MKKIIYRGGVITFEIPESWKEVYSDNDGAEFFEDVPDSPTFRLRLLSFRAPPNAKGKTAEQTLNSMPRVNGKAESLPNGNAIFAFHESVRERGEDLVIYYWLVANTVGTEHCRIADFSLTTLRKGQGQSDSGQLIALLDREIRRAEFSHDIGAVPK